MPIQDHLSYSLGLKTQEGNKALAKIIADTSDHDRLDKLLQFIETKPHERLQMDAMLTVAYIAEMNPEMVVGKVNFLIDKLTDSINRVVFAGMIALAHISHLIPEKLYDCLPQILDAMKVGTVVTKDHGFRILINLYKIEQFTSDMLFIISDQLLLAPHNQLGQYTERMIEVVKLEHKKKLISILEGLREELQSDFHLKRMNKNLKKLYK